MNDKNLKKFMKALLDESEVSAVSSVPEIAPTADPIVVAPPVIADATPVKSEHLASSAPGASQNGSPLSEDEFWGGVMSVPREQSVPPQAPPGTMPPAPAGGRMKGILNSANRYIAHAVGGSAKWMQDRKDRKAEEEVELARQKAEAEAKLSPEEKALRVARIQYVLANRAYDKEFTLRSAVVSTFMRQTETERESRIDSARKTLFEAQSQYNEAKKNLEMH